MSPLRIDSVQRQYEKQTKRPIYLYSGLILIASGILLLINSNLNHQAQNKLYIENPQPGDVYRIREEKDKRAQFYFLRIKEVKGDTVFTYHSNLVYDAFVYKLNEDDYFVKGEHFIFTKPELKKLLEQDIIETVERGYDGSEGFNRIK